MAYKRIVSLLPVAASLALLSLTACSSSFGSGSSPPSRSDVVVLPNGARVVARTARRRPATDGIRRGGLPR